MYNPVPSPPPSSEWSVVATADLIKPRTLRECPSMSVPPPRGLHGRKTLVSDWVGRFDSPVTRRAGTLAGTFSLLIAEAGTARALPCGYVLFERSPIGRASRAAVARIKRGRRSPDDPDLGRPGPHSNVQLGGG